MTDTEKMSDADLIKTLTAELIKTLTAELMRSADAALLRLMPAALGHSIDVLLAAGVSKKEVRQRFKRSSKKEAPMLLLVVDAYLNKSR